MVLWWDGDLLCLREGAPAINTNSPALYGQRMSCQRKKKLSEMFVLCASFTECYSVTRHSKPKEAA